MFGMKSNDIGIIGVMPVGYQDLSKLIEALTLIRNSYGEQTLLVNLGGVPEKLVPLGSITFDSKKKTITFG